MKPAVYLIHKPAGPSSFAAMRQFLGDAKLKACHGGTLDPFAEGLLLILVNPATRLFDFLHDVPKVYEATVRWGVETDNGDLLGKSVFAGDASHLTRELLDAALPQFVGWHEQVPPATSAKRIGGERAYEKAHRGEAVYLPPSRVYLHEAKWLSHDLPRQSRLRIVVRGGYYVRALARDLGRTLGCGAHLTTLHRTAIGPWNDPPPGASTRLQGRDILPWMPLRELSDAEVGQLRQRAPIARGELSPADWNPPIGFPSPPQSVRGFHRGRFRFLLRQTEERNLEVATDLTRGL